MNTGKMIMELRTAQGMSQQALAERLSVSGNLVSKWENGTRRPDWNTVERIADLFGVPADVIVDTKDLLFAELSECFPEDCGLSGEELSARISSFLRTIRQRNADLFIKRYYYHKSAAELADEYEIGENHVRSILSKVRKRLKRKMEETVHE